MTGRQITELLNEYRALNRRSRVVLVVVVVLALAILSGSIVALAFGPVHALAAGLLLALVIWVASSHPIRFPGSESSVSVSETFIFMAAMLFGPPLAVLLASFDGYVSSRRLTGKRTSVLYSVANLSVSAFLSSALYLGVVGPPSGSEGTAPVPFHLIALGAVALALAHYVCNVGLLTLMIWAKYDKNPFRVWLENYLWAVTTFLAGGTAAAIALFAVQRFGFAWLFVGLALTLPIPILIYYTFQTYQEKFEARGRHVQEINTIYRATIEALAMAVGTKDWTSHDRIRRVQLFSQRLGELAGASERDLRALDMASMLHDIGKLGVPEYILNKPGRLTEAELAQARMHAAMGAEILGNVAYPFSVVEMVRSHHERWDGKGYPDGLAGQDIPLGGRILGLVDCYDALRSDRPFRKALTREEALDVLVRDRGTAFEPRLVDLFVAHVDRFEAEAASRPDRGPGFPSLVAAALNPTAPASIAAAPIPSVFERIAEVNQQVTALCDISRRLGSADSTAELVAVLDDRLRSLIPFTTCALHLAQPDGRPSRVVGVLGERADLFVGRGFRAGEGITGWVIANGRAMVNTSPLLDVSALGDDVASEYSAAMVFPIGRENGTLGAISLYSSELERYTDEHICLAESLLDPMADALRHTLRTETSLDEGALDVLTGLWSPSSLEAEAARGIARARRFRLPLSVLMIELGGLDGVERALGVAAADQARREAARLLRPHLREADFAARCGSDSFLVLLVMADAEGAARAARRLATPFESWRPTHDGQELRVELAFGVASWPQDGETTEELITVARRRIERAGPRVTRAANIIPLTGRMNQAR